MRVFLPEGDHTLRLGFIDDEFVKTLAKESLYKDKKNKWIGSIIIVGPFASKDEKASRKKILVCDPKLGAACVDRILTTLARRAYRRPVTPAEVASLTKFVDLAKADGQSAEQGIQLAIQAMLVSPNFLFRIERDPEPATIRAKVHRLTDVELASRLSYFLWNSMPGRRHCSRSPNGGSCASPAVLEAQVKRMLARSEGVRDRRELCRPVAGDPQPRQHQAGPAEVPGLDAGAARRDEDRDADVLRLHAEARTVRSASSSTRATRS